MQGSRLRWIRCAAAEARRAWPSRGLALREKLVSGRNDIASGARFPSDSSSYAGPAARCRRTVQPGSRLLGGSDVIGRVPRVSGTVRRGPGVLAGGAASFGFVAVRGAVGFSLLADRPARDACGGASRCSLACAVLACAVLVRAVVADAIVAEAGRV